MPMKPMKVRAENRPAPSWGQWKKRALWTLAFCLLFTSMTITTTLFVGGIRHHRVLRAGIFHAFGDSSHLEAMATGEDLSALGVLEYDNVVMRKRLEALEDAKTTADAATYKYALARCNWVETSPPTMEKFHIVQLKPESGWERRDHSSLRMKTCILDETNGERWTIRRVGPMEFHGAGDFKMLAWSDPAHLMPSGTDALLTGWTARPVAGDGSPIGFPPLHVHHAHLNPSMNVLDPVDGVDGNYIEIKDKWTSLRVLTDALGLSSGDTMRGLDRATGRAAQLHGDNLCTAEKGGTDCYIHLHNSSEGLRIKSTLAIDLVFEDVRAKDSPPLGDVWAEVMVRTAPIATNVELGFDRIAILPHFPLDRFITYRAPTDMASVSVGTGTFKSSGRVVEHRVHSHRRATNATWVVLGANPEELGWAQWRWPAVIGVPWIALPDAMKVDSLEPTKQRVLRHVAELRRAGREITLCLDNGPQTAFNASSPGYYDRYTELICNDWDMRKGQEWTVISFNQPPKRNPTKRAWWPQHTTVYLKWRPLPGGTPDNNVEFLEASTHMRENDAARRAASVA